MNDNTGLLLLSDAPSPDARPHARVYTPEPGPRVAEIAAKVPLVPSSTVEAAPAPGDTSVPAATSNQPTTADPTAADQSLETSVVRDGPFGDEYASLL